MPDPEPPALELTPARVLCSRHGEPFRARWPRGYALFVLWGFEKLLALPDVAQASGGEIARVPALLDQKPLCCRLPAEDLLALYHAVQAARGPWAEGRCERCGRVGLGGPYLTLNYWGRQRRYGHVCLDCVVYRLRPGPGNN